VKIVAGNSNMKRQNMEDPGLSSKMIVRNMHDMAASPLAFSSSILKRDRLVLALALNASHAGHTSALGQQHCQHCVFVSYFVSLAVFGCRS